MVKIAVPTIGAIPTVYQGIRFRSRLEARWAVFFDQMGWDWEFEPEGYTDGRTRYLPDFWLPSQGAFWEVKRDVFTMNEKELNNALVKAMMLVEVTEKICGVSFGFPQGTYDDQGKLLTLLPHEKSIVQRFPELSARFLDAASVARTHSFWDPR